MINNLKKEISNILHRAITPRRFMILYFAITKQTTGGLFSDFLKNIFCMPCNMLAKKYISIIENYGEVNKLFLKGFDDPLYIPKTYNMDQLYQCITEQFYVWQWHYYQKENTAVNDDDVVLDCGAAEGLFSFIIKNKAKKIYCIEPLPIYRKCLNLTFQNNDNVSLIASALSNINTVGYIADQGISSYITTEKTENEVVITTIDTLCIENNIRPTYIKGDLEGHEGFVVEGAKETISMYKPKIAITTYHRRNDADRLITLIKKYNHKYNIELRGIEHKWGEAVMLHAW